MPTNDDKRPRRIPRNAENKHLLVLGDTGSGKFEHHPAGR
jgi:DNA helicase HerA-like ATPase